MISNKINFFIVSFLYFLFRLNEYFEPSLFNVNVPEKLSASFDKLPLYIPENGYAIDQSLSF